MKNWAGLVGCAIAVFCAANAGYSYVFELSNITNNAYQIRVKLAGIGEPHYVWGPDPYDTKENYENVVEPQSNYELRFDACHGPIDYAGKFGFCLDSSTLEYREVSGEMSLDGAWQPLNVRYLKSDHHDKIVDAAAAIANGLRDVAAAILSAIPVVSPDALRAIKALDLGALVRNIAVFAEYSMCRDRNFYLTYDAENSGPVLMTKAD